MGKKRAPYGNMDHPRKFSIALVILMILALDLLSTCDILSGKAGETPSRTPLDVRGF